MNQPTLKPGFNCPSCGVGLVMADRQGIEIDYCPQCRGVWLDRGELDKLIERSGQHQQAAIAPQPQPQPQPQPGPFAASPQPGYGQVPQAPYRERDHDYRDRDRDYRDRDDHGHYGKQKRRKSFLEQIFD